MVGEVAPARRLVVVANRLPMTMTSSGYWETSPGGLVSALTPALRERDGLWVGWSGSPDEKVEPFDAEGIRVVPIDLSEDQVDGYYRGFCNGTVWPLYHDWIRAPTFSRRWWGPYQEVNRKFAEATAAVSDEDDIVWVHDYQLQLVPGALRSLRPNATIGFFLHIPFPPVELYARLPWRTQVLEGLLGADVVAFQTRSSAANFAAAARRFAGAKRVGTGILEHGGRMIRFERAPIGMDTAYFAGLAADEEVRRRSADMLARLGNPRRLILGVDRLDYTKGIDVRLKAFQTVMGRGSAGPEDLQFLQIAVPSREDVTFYQEERDEIERLVGQINGEHSRAGLPAVHYMYRSFDAEDLVAAYVSADVMMVTPLRDGMNLVAKEYVATRIDDTGVLVLSEFAGSAEQLTSALLVNPHDVDSVAATLETALEMSPAEQRRRMRTMRRVVDSSDVHSWVAGCIDNLDST
jgi:trehalose 6-phosphate synthase